MRKIVWSFIIAASALLSGCANKVDYNQRSMLLSLGMNKNSVMEIMGPPKRTDVNSERERWIYWSDVMYGFTVINNEQLATDRLTVTFVNGKVTKWGQQTFTDDMMESSQKTAAAYAEAFKPQTAK